METERSGLMASVAENEQVLGKAEYFFYSQNSSGDGMSDAGLRLLQENDVPFQVAVTDISNVTPLSFVWSAALAYRSYGMRVAATDDRISLLLVAPTGPIDPN